ncbi:MAG: hypothetical protein HRT74_07960 [Flavobacteriales bacterium]|nr:hypothetical protein [Flavobacteriales bacterium]
MKAPVLRFILAISLFIFVGYHSFAQDGCTNVWAVNYDPSAVVDDGSCEIYQNETLLDATLDIPINIGTGISNEHMTIVNHGPIQMGAKINERFIDDVIPTGNEYFITRGYSRTSFFDETPNPPNAKWDLIFSVDLDQYTYNDLDVFVSMDFDPLDGETQAESYQLDLSTGLQGIGLGGSSIRQQSENLAFPFWLVLTPNASLFDATQPGEYDLGVRLVNKAGNELSSVFIRVIVEDAVEGCTDPEACNFDPTANLDDNTCEYPQANLNCAGECEHDFNNNGICDEEEIYGCNYPSAINFDPASTFDDGTCEFDGMTCLGDFDNNGIINVEDLATFLSVYGESCEE